MAWPRGYPSLQFYPTVEGCAYSGGVRCSGLLTKKLCCGLVEFVAVAANFPHQLSGLLKRDVMLLREVVSVIGGVRVRRRTPQLLFFSFAMPRAFGHRSQDGPHRREF